MKYLSTAGETCLRFLTITVVHLKSSEQAESRHTKQRHSDWSSREIAECIPGSESYPSATTNLHKEGQDG